MRYFHSWNNLRSQFFDLVIFHLLHLAEHHTTTVLPKRQASTLKREFSASTVDSVGQVSRLVQLRMEELQSLRESVESSGDAQVIGKVPPELRIYVQARVFKQWDQALAKYQEWKMTKTQDQGFPEINVEGLLVEIDDGNEFGKFSEY